MNKSDKISDLQRSITANEIKAKGLEAEELTVRDSISDFSNAIRKTDEVLSRPYSYPDHMNATNARATAFRGRSEASAKLNRLQVESNTVKIRLSELRIALDRAQYEAISDAELTRQQHEVNAAIKSAGTRQDNLRKDLNALRAKRRVAEEALDALRAAERELSEAEQAFEAQQGEAYIEDRDADLSDYEARITKARESLEDAKVDATGASAAIPRLDERIAAANEAFDEEAANSESLTKAYFEIQLRMAEREYLKHAHSLVDCLKTLVAIGQITGNQLGTRLLDKMRSSVFVPIEGQHAQALNTSPWFGSSLLPDVTNTTARLTADLQAAKGL